MIKLRMAEVSAYARAMRCPVLARRVVLSLHACYAMPGTDAAEGGTGSAYAALESDRARARI
eukprot:401549-Rhodomonas_salina.4